MLNYLFMYRSKAIGHHLMVKWALNEGIFPLQFTHRRVFFIAIMLQLLLKMKILMWQSSFLHV